MSAISTWVCKLSLLCCSLDTHGLQHGLSNAAQSGCTRLLCHTARQIDPYIRPRYTEILHILATLKNSRIQACQSTGCTAMGQYKHSSLVGLHQRPQQPISQAHVHMSMPRFPWHSIKQDTFESSHLWKFAALQQKRYLFHVPI